MRLATDWARWVALAAVLVAVTTGATVQTAVSARAAGVPLFGSNLGWLTLNPGHWAAVDDANVVDVDAVPVGIPGVGGAR